MKAPRNRQPKRRRLWLNEASCIRLRPTHPMHVWSYDMVMERTSNGRSFRILNILDEYSRECLKGTSKNQRLRGKSPFLQVSDQFFILLYWVSGSD